MLQRLLLISTFVAASLATYSSLDAQLYFEDFESANIGDPVSSLGITGFLGDYLIESNGVNGTQGFESILIPGLNWQMGFLPVDFSIHNTGDVLTIGMDAQIVLSSNTFDHLVSFFDFGMWGETDTFLAAMMIHDEANTLELMNAAWGSNIDSLSEISKSSTPLSAIGLNSIPDGISEFFTFRVQFYKRSENDFVFATSIFDVQGTEVLRHVTSSVGLDPVFQDPLFVRLTINEWQNFESVRLDNFLYEVRTVLLGDANLDGDVNLLDVAPFIDVISSGHYQIEADVNQDGYADLLDVAAFIGVLD